MLIVYWPITTKFRICKQTSKPQTNYCCCLWFSYLAPYWLISRNTITFHKYFWCSQFCEFHSKRVPFFNDWYTKWVSFLSKIVYKRVTGLDLRVEPPSLRFCWVLVVNRDFKIQQPDGRENDAKKWICILSVFIAIIPTHLLYQI